MQTLTVKLRKHHPGQAQLTREARRFNVVAWGRRGGKSAYGEDRLIHPALAGQPVGWFGPTYKVLGDAWRDVRRILQPVTLSSNATDRRIELITGGAVEMWTLENKDAGRSRKYKRVIIDEAGLVHDLGAIWQEAIRPTLADLEGDAWFLGTPKGMNYFKRIFDYGQDPLRPEWKSWQMPTSVNPFIKASEIAAARQELPERTFRQEWLAEFIEDAGGVFRKVRGAATCQRREPYSGRFVAGLDWAQTHDFTVMVVIDADTRRVVDMDRFNQIDWAIQRGRVKAMTERWGVTDILAESNSIGGPNIEALWADGLPVTAFETTATSKPPLIESLALAFEKSEIEILDDPVLIGELEAYERTVSAVTGRSRFGAPEGMHDDTVMALALAWQGVATSGPLFFFAED